MGLDELDESDDVGQVVRTAIAKGKARATAWNVTARALGTVDDLRELLGMGADYFARAAMDDVARQLAEDKEWRGRDLQFIIIYGPRVRKALVGQWPPAEAAND